MAKAVAKTSKARTRRERARTGLYEDALVKASSRVRIRARVRVKATARRKVRKRTRAKVRTRIGGRAPEEAAARVTEG